MFLPSLSLSLKVDSGLLQEVIVLRVPDIPGNRLVFAPTGPLNRDYDDVRRFSDAAYNGMQRSVEESWCFMLLISIPMSSVFLISLSFQGPESWHDEAPACLPPSRRL